MKRVGDVQPRVSGRFLLVLVGKRREVNGADHNGLEVWKRVEVTGRQPELRENAEYQVWYVKKPVFTEKKNFKGSLSQVYSKL